jgi:hypothetical protein
MHLLRTRAALRAPIHHPNRQENLPEIGQTLAYTANREGVAERCLDPAVPTRLARDLTLIGQDDRWLTAVERDRVQPVTAHKAPTCYRLRSIPGGGTLLALVRRDDIQALRRLPRGQECVASCPLVTCAQAAAGTKLSHASRTGAVSAAAGLFRRHHPAGQQDRARLVQNHGQGNAVPVLAHPWARAV